MPVIILALFIGVPILEIAVFIKVGNIFGLWPTLAGIVATAIIGGAIIRIQGLATIDRARRSMEQGQPPVGEVFTGICLLLAGALLMTPGFLTDSIGFLLLVPAVRQSLGQWLVRKLLGGRNARVWVGGEEVIRPGHRAGKTPPDAIDVDFTEVPPGNGDRPADH